MERDSNYAKKYVSHIGLIPEGIYAESEIKKEYQNAINSEDLRSRNMTTFQSEMFVLGMVKNGDTDGVEKVIEAVSSGTVEIGLMSENTLLQARYTLVSALTLITRAAILGGMAENEAYALSDAYLRKADTLSTPRKLTFLAFSALRDFTGRVKKLYRTNYESLPVNKAVKFLENHLREKLSLSEIAAHCKVTPQYLSAVFKKETGKTLTEYARYRKIELAKELLLSGNSVQTVSDITAFSSPSKFIEAFKKETGETPIRWKQGRAGKQINILNV